MKESAKKQLVRSRLKWAGHVETNWQRGRCRESGGQKDARKTENAMDGLH